MVNPESYVRRHGGDIFRTHLLSSGRWAGTADFRDAGIVGVERLFTRLWRLAQGEVRVDGRGGGGGAGERALAEASASIGAAIEAMRFNVAVAVLGGLARTAAPAEAPTLALLLAPFAPFLAEELWAATGGAPSVHAQPWPQSEPEPVAAGPVELVVQVDGRVRDRLAVPAGLSAGEARARAEAAPNVVRNLGGRAVLRSVHVPDRLVNLVTASSGKATGRFEPG